MLNRKRMMILACSSFFLIFLSESCNKSYRDQPEESTYAAYAKSLYYTLYSYYKTEGHYPEDISDLKKIFAHNEIQENHWDEFIDKKWDYQKPDLSKKSQIIFRDYKYGIYVEVHYIDGEMKLTKIK